MSESQYCQAHIINIQTQPLLQAYEAAKTIDNYSEWLCQLLALCHINPNQYEAAVCKKLLHIITINSQAASEAYDIIDRFGTVKDQLQVSFESCSSQMQNLILSL
jgi:hypothetical protein